MQTVMDTTLHPVAFVVVVGGGLAVWNAYWNDGLLLSWLLVFSLVTPWLLHYNLHLGIYEPFVSAGYVTVALVSGTIGYLLGIWGRRYRLRDTEPMGSHGLTVVFGAAPDSTARWSFVVSGLFLIAAALLLGAGPYRSVLVSLVYPVALFYPIGTITAEAILGVGIIVGWVMVALWPAYRGNGVLVSWSVLFAPMFGVLLAYSLVDSFFTTDVTGTVVDAVVSAALVAGATAVILGALGFVGGALLRNPATTPRGGPEHIDE